MKRILLIATLIWIFLLSGCAGWQSVEPTRYQHRCDCLAQCKHAYITSHSPYSYGIRREPPVRHKTFSSFMQAVIAGEAGKVWGE